jgi:hypothetical protein
MSTVPTRDVIPADREPWSREVPLTLAFLATALTPFVLADHGAALVLAPLLAATLTSFGFFWTLYRRRHGSMPWFEIGAVYVAVVIVYLAYPLIGYLALGQRYTPTNDGRLASSQPGPFAVAAIGWLYVWHLIGFVLGYLAVRGRLRIRPVMLPPPGSAVFIAIVLVYLAIEAFGVFVGLFYDTRAETYVQTYLIAQRLPLLIAQFVNHLNGIRYALAVMLMAALFTRYPRSRLVIGAWLLVSAAATIVRLGSRTDLVLLVLSAMMMYDTLVRPLSMRFVVATGAAALTGLVLFGIARSHAAGMAASSFNPFGYVSEFENLFANSIHLAGIASTIQALPRAFYLSDFAALIPQQFAPFIKVSPADWYVTTFFPGYAAMGGGLAFGTITEAVLSGGWFSALVRGTLLGCFFAGIHRFYSRHTESFWVFAFYVWFATLTYQSFRNTTFYFLVLCVFRFVPALIAVNLLASVLKRAAWSAASVASKSPLKA